MEPSPERDLNLNSGDTNADRPRPDSFLEEADDEALVENLTPDGEGSPVIRYIYPKLV
jgi:hypothetical protein